MTMGTGPMFVRLAAEVGQATLAIKHLEDTLRAPHYLGMPDSPAPLCREQDLDWKPPERAASTTSNPALVKCARCLEWMHA